MRWQLSTREAEDVTIVDAIEALMSPGESYSDLKDTVRGLLENGIKKILVNLANVRFIDSTGLGDLIGCYTRAENQSAKMKLLNPQSKVYELISITRLATVFEIYYDEPEAIRSFHS